MTAAAAALLHPGAVPGRDALDRLAGDAEHLDNVDAVTREVVQAPVVGLLAGVVVRLFNGADAVAKHPDGGIVQIEHQAQQLVVHPERVGELAGDERTQQRLADFVLSLYCTLVLRKRENNLAF